jgi:predicted dehydrogenase
MFRFGVLGASHFALHKMIPAMQAGGDTPVVAIASRDGAKAAEAARARGIPKTYTRYEDLLADPDIDAVYIPLPNHLHVPWAERAAAAGKHVLVEKPVALGAGEARFAPDMGGGVLLDVGFYPVTMSRFCFDDEPTAVAATMEHDADAGVDVMTSAILRFPRGHAIFTCGMQLAPEQRAQLLGSKGHIDIGYAWNPASDQPCALVLETSDRLEVTAAERIEFAPVNQYTILAQLFARAAATGGPAPVPLEDSIKNMSVLDALRRSAASGRWETV